MFLLPNKKVLLRERKRHTARPVVSTPSVVLPGYPPGGYPVSYPPRGGPGTPPGGVWVPPGGVRVPTSPPGGYPVRYPPGGVRVPPWGGPGTPPGGTRSGTPRGGTRTPLGGVWVPPLVPHGILGNVAKHYGIWVPPPCGQTNKVKLLPSRRTTYAGGNNSGHPTHWFNRR